MSKASEWAAEYQQRVRSMEGAPFFVGFQQGGRGYGEREGGATVGAYGQLVLMDCDMDPKRALDLASWLVDTFGEPK